MYENYLVKDFKNRAADLGPVLVDTCSLKKRMLEHNKLTMRSICAKSLILMTAATGFPKILQKTFNSYHSPDFKAVKVRNRWFPHPPPPPPTPDKISEAAVLLSSSKENRFSEELEKRFLFFFENLEKCSFSGEKNRFRQKLRLLLLARLE